MISDVRIIFDRALEDKFKEKLDVKNFLLKHPRKELCLRNLCDQIIRAENLSILVNANTYASVIKDVAMIFAKACLEKVEQDHYSQARINQIKAEQNALNEAKELLKDLEKDTVNDRKLTEIERSEIKQAIEARGTTD